MGLGLACGSGERSFTAQEFVQAANEEGARLELGPPLSTDDPSAELYEVELEPSQATRSAAGHQHSGGSLTVAESAEAAEAEYRRCEAAVTLFCYRAANVALAFEQDADPAVLGELAAALRALRSG